MIDLPGLLFTGSACFVLGLVFEMLLWDVRAMAEPYTEATSDAITAFYVNATVGTRQRAPYLLVVMPLAFLTVIASLAYKYVHGLAVGDHHAIVTSAWSMVIVFPLIALVGVSVLPAIHALVTRHSTLPLETRRRLHRRLFVQHLVDVVLTTVAIVVHIAM